jgi:hypothetical protein
VPGVTDRYGAAWERKVADYAHDNYRLPWHKAPLRGTRDLLDIAGCLDMGWLVGCKSIHRGVPFGTRISEAMAQADKALVNAGCGATSHRGAGTGEYLIVDSGRIVPVQVMQRSGYPVGKAYVVTQYEYFLRLVAERANSWQAATMGAGRG